MTKPLPRRALLSVSDKTGIVEFAKLLTSLEVEILSTGGTARLLSQHQIPVTEVSDYTQFPEILDGRVKTLQSKIFGGILARRGQDDAVLSELDIAPIDIVIVNLYPFSKVTKGPHTFELAIENIDIGGPSLIRAAAKNHKDVIVVVDPNDYHEIGKALTSQSMDQTSRLALAKKAFAHTAAYDGYIANYLYQLDENDKPAKQFPDTLSLQWQKQSDLRYGENPHQQAALYQDNHCDTPSVAHAQQLQGKALSFNNIADADAALSCVQEFELPACVIVKHANPCGVAQAENILHAYENAYRTDPTSSFGGIIAFNREVDAQTADAIISRQFVEVIIAPSFAEDALEIFASKVNLRLLGTGEFTTRKPSWDMKRIQGGLLIQDNDIAVVNEHDLQVVSERAPSPQELQDCLFAWKVVHYVKSNAIVYCKDNATIGIGAGQMSRVYSAKIAGIKAADEGLSIEGCVMASDAFFPFRDGIDEAAKLGITAIIQPGGSKRDDEVIQAANEAGIAMVFTNIRHFRH